MLRQLLVGGAVSVCNIAIHALVMASVVHLATRMAAARHMVDQSVRLAVVIIAAAPIATVPVLMIAHFLEVMVWSLAYAIVGAAPAGADPVYFAFVNYTTLGYGDVTLLTFKVVRLITAAPIALKSWKTLKVILLYLGFGIAVPKHIRAWMRSRDRRHIELECNRTELDFRQNLEGEMKQTKMLLTIFLAALLSSSATGVFAGNWATNHPRREQVKDRLQNQNRRINNEVRNGEINKGQAQQLHQDDRAIRQEERTMSSMNNGHITRTEQRALNQQENAVSRQIGH